MSGASAHGFFGSTLHAGYASARTQSFTIHLDEGKVQRPVYRRHDLNLGCSVERGNSDLWRLREMTSGENREEEHRCRRSVQEPLIVALMATRMRVRSFLRILSAALKMEV